MKKDMWIAILAYIFFVWWMDDIYQLFGHHLPSGLWLLDTRPIAIALMFALLFIILRLIEQKPFSHYGFKNPRAKEYKTMIFFLLVLMPLAFLARLADPGFDTWYGSITGLTTTLGLLSFMLIMPFYVIKEEIAVRVFMQNRMRNLGFGWMAIALSAAFAIAHYWPSQTIHVIVQVISVFFGSFILIAHYHVNRNIYMAILLHLLYNWIIVFQIYLHIKNIYAEIAFWIIMLLFFGIVFIRWLKNPKGIEHFRKAFPKITWSEAAFLIAFALIVPIAIILIQ